MSTSQEQTSATETLTESERMARTWPFLAAQFAEERQYETAQATCLISSSKTCATINGGDDSCLDDCLF